MLRSRNAQDTQNTPMKIWNVFAVANFYGYSESLGAGRETKEYVTTFTSEAAANEYVESKKAAYSARDERLEIEEGIANPNPTAIAPASPKASNEEIANFFLSRT